MFKYQKQRTNVMLVQYFNQANLIRHSASILMCFIFAQSNILNVLLLHRDIAPKLRKGDSEHTEIRASYTIHTCIISLVLSVFPAPLSPEMTTTWFSSKDDIRE